MLLSFAEVCDIDMGIDDTETNNILAQFRTLDAAKLEEGDKMANQWDPL